MNTSHIYLYVNTLHIHLNKKNDIYALLAIKVGKRSLVCTNTILDLSVLGYTRYNVLLFCVSESLTGQRTFKQRPH